MSDDIASLKTTVLIDEQERSLKSLQDYKDVWEHIIAVMPIVAQYMSTNLLITTGDWPTWYFQKKMIAQVMIGTLLTHTVQ